MKLYKKAVRKQMRKYQYLKYKKNKKKKQTLIFPINEKNDWIDELSEDAVDHHDKPAN